MGSGKTTIGKQVAERLNMPFHDLDQEIEAQEGMSINEIFSKHGEEHFRALERKYLVELIRVPDPIVIAMGGGTPCFNHMHQLLIRNGFVAYLKLSPEVLIKSILESGTNRPLVEGLTGDELESFVTSHVREREYYYQFCDIEVNPRNSDAVDQIADAFSKYREKMLQSK
jgi:shikimate kinase